MVEGINQRTASTRFKDGHEQEITVGSEAKAVQAKRTAQIQQEVIVRPMVVLLWMRVGCTE